MRRLLTASSLLLAGLALATGPLAAVAVGDAAPAFSLKNLNGKAVSLADYKGKVVVLEWVNPKCPYSDRHAQEKTMTELTRKYGKVTWLGINSTNPDHGNFLQPAEHQAWAKKNGVTYDILYDPTGATGHAYDAKTTPHMYIIDAQGKIAYNGAIDDDANGRVAKAQRVNYVDGGLGAQMASKAVNPASTKPYGCSVKY